MSKAQQIFDDWHYYGTPRSPEYQAGCLYILRRKLDGIAQQLCPYRVGTAQADAWFAGCDAGHVLVKRESDRLLEAAQV